jgi:hypothetical protein
METLVNQQLFAIKELKDLLAALEEELEAATSCQEVDNSQLLNASKDDEADLVKFCKDLGESSRDQTLGSARTSARKFPGSPRAGYWSGSASGR